MEFELEGDMRIEIDDKGNLKSAQYYLQILDCWIDITQTVELDRHANRVVTKAIEEFMFNRAQNN